MLTDEGFLFFINATPNTDVMSFIRVGTKKEDIVDLNPPSSIVDIQSSTWVQWFNHTGTNYGTSVSTRHIQIYSKSLKTAFFIGSSGSSYSEVESYYEFGLYSNRNKLLVYTQNTNLSKTFLYPKEAKRSQTFSFNLSLTVPFKTKTITQTIKNKGADQNYKIKIAARNTWTTLADYDILKGLVLKLNATNATDNNQNVTTDVVLGSYDIPTKKVTYNLIADVDVAHANKPEYKLTLRTSFGFFDITFHDAVTDENLGLPLVDIGSLVIPLTLNLGEMM